MLFLVVVITSFLQMTTVGAIPLVVSALQSPEAIAEHSAYKLAAQYLGIDSIPVVDFAILFLLLVFVFSNLMRVLVIYLRSRIVRDFTIDLSDRLFGCYINAPYTFHLGTNTALAIRNLTTEVSATVSNFNSIVSLFMALMTIILIFALLISQDPLLTAFVMFAGIVGSAIVFVMTRRVSSKMGKIVHIEQAQMIKIINHAFGGIRDIQILNRLDWFSEQFSQSLKKFCQSKLKQTLVSGVIQPLIQSAGLLALMVIVFIAYVSDGGMAELLPTIALFGAALHRLMPNLSEAISTAGQLYFGAAGTEAVVGDIRKFSQPGEYLHIEETTGDVSAPVQFVNSIELQNIRYTYPEANRASLIDISLHCNRGEMIGLVGETGSGKSTIVDIILGLITPESGAVLVDDLDVTGIENRWQGTVGMVSQSVFLMDETIRTNVAMGLPEDKVDDEKVWRALGLAQIDDVVKKLPLGLDEVVGERGIRLSGGERQRLALARAILSEPSVLIMDEGTSALDNQTEKRLMNAIKSLRSNYTLIMVAHRLSSVSECDRLYVIEAGQIAACGSYDELVKSSEKFRALAFA